jgi:glycosyltransferase involved in cell wall biosynthesis
MRVAVWAGNSIGGTEKAATLFAVGLAGRGYQVDFLGPRGPRTEQLEQAGVPILNIVLDKASLASYLRHAKPDVVHQHVPGYPIENPLYEILSDLRVEAPHLIETNVFGRFEDPAAAKFLKYRMFVSLSAAVKAFSRAGRRLDAHALESCTVLYNPLELMPALAASERIRFRMQLGVAQGDILVLRIGQRAFPGQPGNKWKRWECEAFARAKVRAPALRLLMMEPPADIWRDVEAACYGPGIILRKNTSDFAWLQKLYAAADAMIHASSYGESFGYTIAEAMGAGSPVIVRTTPWGDNAQVELVANGETGFVCASVAEMSRRLADLALNPDLRLAMGRRSRDRIQAKGNLETELNVLEDVLSCVCTGTRGPALEMRGRELLSFANQFTHLEWTISEPFRHQPWHYFGARLYATYRRARTRAARLRRLMKSRQVFLN